MKKQGRNVFSDLSACTSPSQYSTHWHVILTMELRGSIVDGVRDRWPTLFMKPADFLVKVYGETPDSVTSLIRLVVRRVSHTTGTTNMSCDTSDVRLTKKIVQDMAGMSVCAGYLSDYHGKVGTPLTLFFCRAIHVQAGNIDEVGLGGNVDYAQVRICANRRLISKFRISPEDCIHIQTMTSLASIARMYQAVQRVSFLPHSILTTLLDLRISTPIQNPMDDLTASIHPYVLAYIRDLSKGGKYNDMQVRSAIMVMARLADGSLGSTSLSIIQGPPATVKIASFSLQIGCILVDPRFGNVARPQLNLLNRSDCLIRCSKNPLALRILLCGPSNQATDNVMKRINAGSISDRKGGSFKPQMVRIAKQGYDYGALAEFAMNDKALPLDKEIFHKEEGDKRKCASSKARRVMTEETVILGMTLNMAGSSRLKELRSSFDLIMVDEAAQCLEPELLIPMVATCKHSRYHRLHVVAYGDHNQLPAVSDGTFLAKQSLVASTVQYDKNKRSLFERLVSENKIPIIVLNEQFRMHPKIADTFLPIFYSTCIFSPLGSSPFRTDYNSLLDSGQEYQPCTILDTRVCLKRFEVNNGFGNIIIVVELLAAQSVVEQLLRIVVSKALVGNVGILAPYLSQVRALQDHMDCRPHLHALQMHVDSIDSMQGEERNIIIFSATRSNAQRQVGFLRKWRRWNVAVSRARRLLVVIGDFAFFAMVRFYLSIRRWNLRGKGNMDPATSSSFMMMMTLELRHLSYATALLAYVVCQDCFLANSLFWF